MNDTGVSEEAVGIGEAVQGTNALTMLQACDGTALQTAVLVAVGQERSR